MQSIQRYIDRLYEEWMQHGKIIIGVDYDDTISPWKIADDKQCQEIIDVVKAATHTGAFVVIHTACNDDRYPEIYKYCESKGIHVSSINQNPISLPYGNGKKSKPMCNLYLDDRAGLSEALEILKVAMYRKRGSDYKDSLTEQNSV